MPDAQPDKPLPSERPKKKAQPEPMPTATMDLGAKPVTYFFPLATLASGETVTCPHSKYGHESLTASYRTWRPGTGSPVVTSLMTSRWRPEAAAWPRCWPTTPRWSYFRSSDEEFARCYAEQLDRYGPQRIAAELARIAATAYEAPSDRLVLICWEADPARCHRSQFADWWLHATGEPIHELT